MPVTAFTVKLYYSVVGNIHKNMPVTAFPVTVIWGAPIEKASFNMHKMCRFRSSYACVKYHTGLCSPLIHSVESNGSVSGLREIPTQSDLGLHLHSLIWVFTVHICLKTSFCMEWPI